MLLGAAVALFFLWTGCLIAMAVYSATRPPERIVPLSPASSAAVPQNLNGR
jgi:hypothetical protein